MATLSYRRSERTTLYIETREGDVVRLRIQVRDSLTAATGSAQDGASDTAVRAGETATPAIGLSLKLQLYRATLVEVAAALPADSRAETSGVPLAADALEALAATQAPPLEARA